MEFEPGRCAIRTDFFIEPINEARYFSKELYELAIMVTHRSSEECVVGYHGTLYTLYKVVRTFFATPGADHCTLSPSTSWLSNLEYPLSVKVNSDVSFENLEKELRKVIPLKRAEFYK